jgi:anti-repressor protein
VSEIEIFTFPATGDPVRSAVIDGEPWFVGRDVAAVLGYANGSRDITRHTTERQRREYRIGTPSGEQTAVLISEPGVYRMVMRSNQPRAVEFQDWLAEEVIPAIRRTGRYEVPALLSDPLAALERQTLLTTQAIEIAKTERARAEAAEQQVAELAPEAARARRTMDAHGLALVGTVAKRFGIKEKALREFLYAEGLLIRSGVRRNEPMARYIASGHFELKTTLVDVDPDRPPVERSVTYVTPKGEVLICRRLRPLTAPTRPAAGARHHRPVAAARLGQRKRSPTSCFATRFEETTRV